MTADRLKPCAMSRTQGRERSGPDEWELAQVERARRNPAAFAPLYEAYADLVWSFAQSRLGDRERAADATSQTFAKAIAALPSFRPEAGSSGNTFRPWLMTIARNVVIDEVRRMRPTTPLDEPTAGVQLIARDRSPEESAIAAAERQRIEQALTRLPEAQRQIVELRAAGMRGVEIAELLNMSLAAVRTANHRAYRKLRELLSEPETTQDTTR